MIGLTKESSSRVGFIVDALMAGAIDNSEVCEWAETVITTSSEYPLWLVDLLDFDEPAFHIYRIIGFTPSSPLSRVQSMALLGVALKRGWEIDETVTNPERAKKALESHTEVLAMLASEIPSLSVLLT